MFYSFLHPAQHNIPVRKLHTDQPSSDKVETQYSSQSFSTATQLGYLHKMKHKTRKHNRKDSFQWFFCCGFQNANKILKVTTQSDNSDSPEGVFLSGRMTGNSWQRECRDNSTQQCGGQTRLLLKCLLTRKLKLQKPGSPITMSVTCWRQFRNVTRRLRPTNCSEQADRGNRQLGP